MNDKQRQHFDRQLDLVLRDLPTDVRDLMDQVPLIVDDCPSPKLMRELGEKHRNDLCGLYTGIPLTETSIEQLPQPTPVVHLFREGIISLVMDEAGFLSDQELRRQIRLTILHEYGHHHGLDEDDLEELGY